MLVIQYLDLVKVNRNVALPLTDHPTLLIQRGLPARCEEGEGYFFSIGIIHDPEKKTYEYQMEFIVIDMRSHPKDYNQLLIYPISTRDDINRVTESSCLIIDWTVENVLTKLQINLTALAEQWLHELYVAGYPDKTADGD